MKRREANPDEAISRVLTGLREAQPPQGMQQRLLLAVTERAETRPQSYLQLLFAVTPWMAATAGAAVIALTVFWTATQTHRATHSPAPSTPAIAPVSETRLPPINITRPRPVIERRQPSPEEHASPVEPATDEESLAVSEMNAPSYPAPPMPLTDQEKLLVQILHKADPVEFAMLDPGVRNSEETGDKADFDRFFKQPPKIVEIKLPLNNKLPTGDEK